MNPQDYYDMRIMTLQTERNSITKTGNITPEQRNRLNYLDHELKLWCKYQDIFIEIKKSSRLSAQPSLVQQQEPRQQEQQPQEQQPQEQPQEQQPSLQSSS